MKNQIAEKYEELDERITNIYAGISMWLSPVVDGNKQYAPYINKQLFNAARPYAATYEEFKTKYGEMTYSQVTTALHDWTLYQLAFYAAVLIGLVTFVIIFIFHCGLYLSEVMQIYKWYLDYIYTK